MSSVLEVSNVQDGLSLQESSARIFRELVLKRRYDFARKYFNALSFEEQTYIESKEQYSRWLKPLRFRF